MLVRTEPACLVIADIAGYSGYLAGVELDHAQDILADLVDVIVGGLRPAFKLAKLEGDAAFAYVPATTVDGPGLRDVIERCYFAFQRRIRDIRQASTCECNACVRMPGLDLKFVAHHGRFGRQHVAGGEELSGSDVILVHRLLKNRVVEELGHPGYAFYTDAVVAAMGVEPDALRMRRHAEEVQEIGPVEGWVQDLHDRWAEERERRRVKVGPAEAATTMTYDLPAPRSMTWSYLTEPGLRTAWTPGVQRIDETTDGRRGAGTRSHCEHGKGAVLEEILDWRPFDYFTIDRNVPMPFLKPIRITFELEDTPEGTRLTEYSVPAPGVGQRLAFAVMTRMQAGHMKHAYASLGAALAAAAGTTSTDGSAPGPSEEAG